MGQELADPLPLLFDRRRLEGKFDDFGVALVSREPELQTIQLHLAIVPLINAKRRVEVTGPVSRMLVGRGRADCGGRSEDTRTQHAAAATIDNCRIHRPVDRGFFRERLRVNAGNEYYRNNRKTFHEILLDLKRMSSKVERGSYRSASASARAGLTVTHGIVDNTSVVVVGIRRGDDAPPYRFGQCLDRVAHCALLPLGFTNDAPRIHTQAFPKRSLSAG